jgi:hypothetical protein
MRFFQGSVSLAGVFFVCVVLSFYQDRRLNNQNNSVLEESLLEFKTNGPSFMRHLPIIGTPKPNATIVIQLMGEMGNNLHKISHGLGLQIRASQNNITTNLVLKHQNHKKWYSASQNIKKCFTKLRDFDFSAGNRAEMRERELAQKLWLGAKCLPLVNIVNVDYNSTSLVLKTLQDVLLKGEQIPKTEEHAKIVLPYVLADPHMKIIGMTQMYQFPREFREFFQFDDEACCAQIPDEDESVFHFRNFKTELVSATEMLGFEELSPEKTANELFGKLPVGSKVAITTRFNNENTQKYVKALEQRGLRVRVVSEQTSVQDFCFLKHAKKELVGMLSSTFFLWAAFLGDGNVRAFSVTTPLHPKSKIEFEWSVPELKDRFSHEVYQSEVMDQVVKSLAIKH